MPLPLLTFDMETQIDSVDPMGAQIRFRYTGADAQPLPGVPELVLEETQRSIRSLEGLEGSYVLSNCLYAEYDAVLDAETLDGVDPAVKVQLDDFQNTVGLFSDPLPDEAVGVGAQWEVEWTRVENDGIYSYTGGIRLKQTATYTVESIDGDRVLLSSVFRHEAQAQDIEPPELGEALVHLVSLTGTGQGRVLLDLGRSVPVEAETEMVTQQTLTVDKGRGEARQVQEVSVRTSLSMVEE